MSTSRPGRPVQLKMVARFALLVGLRSHAIWMPWCTVRLRRSPFASATSCISGAVRRIKFMIWLPMALLGLLGDGHRLQAAILTDSLDQYSLECLVCHAGSGEPGQLGIESDVSAHVYVNHPIGVIYASFEQSGSFRAQSLLMKRILLPSGKVSCISCHDDKSKPHGRLVMTNRGSALCLECHQL